MLCVLVACLCLSRERAVTCGALWHFCLPSTIMSSTSVNALAPSTSIATKIVIRELVAAADAVHDAAKVRRGPDNLSEKLICDTTPQAMKNCKNDSRKISKLALEIAASVENTAATTQLHGDASLPVAIAAALGATKEYVLTGQPYSR